MRKALLMGLLKTCTRVISFAISSGIAYKCSSTLLWDTALPYFHIQQVSFGHSADEEMHIVHKAVPYVHFQCNVIVRNETLNKYQGLTKLNENVLRVGERGNMRLSLKSFLAELFQLYMRYSCVSVWWLCISPAPFFPLPCSQKITLPGNYLFCILRKYCYKRIFYSGKKHYHLSVMV